MSLVYVVEDDQDIREIEKFALKNSGFLVKEAETSRELDALLSEEIPNLIILDVMLPGESGLDILGKLREHELYKDIPIIMVTAKTTELDKVRGLDLGADDYLTKPFGIMELVSRVNALLRRVKTTDEKNQIQYEDLIIDKSAHSLSIAGNKIELTYKEYELLWYLLVNRGIVISREKMMNQIWGFDYQGESRTVDMHIKTLRQKLGEKGGIIKTIRNVGYLIE